MSSNGSSNDSMNPYYNNSQRNSSSGSAGVVGDTRAIVSVSGTDDGGDVYLPPPSAIRQELTSILNQACNQTSDETKEAIENDLSAKTDNTLDEGDEDSFVGTKLEELKACLARHLQQPPPPPPANDSSPPPSLLILPTAALQQAQNENAGYVHSKRNYLRFLRAEGFQPEAAARRMIRHFDKKQQLFGNRLLTQDIQLSDLDEEDLQEFRNGHLQRLSQRDRIGRAVLVQCWKGGTTSQDALVYWKRQVSPSSVLECLLSHGYP